MAKPPNAEAYSRYVDLILCPGALARGAFGIDYHDYAEFPLGSKHSDKEYGPTLRQGV